MGRSKASDFSSTTANAGDLPRSKKAKKKKKIQQAENTNPKQTVNGNSKLAQDTKPKYTVDQLLDKAEEYIDTFEFELAQRFCQRALEQEVDNVRALETSGTLMMEVGQTEQAKACFGRAVELSPDEGHSKYMYLGQLFTGSDAISFFRKGVSIMEDNIKKQGEQAAGAGFCEGEVTCRDISNAHCSIAEIYLTDACDEEDADVQCKAYLERALQADSTNPDAYQISASLHLSKQDKHTARELAERGVSLWLPAWKEADKPDGEQIDPIEVCSVSYPSRLTAAKLLVEVENYELASEILELLLDEEDEVVEVWYCLGWLNYMQGSDYQGNARFYLNKASEVAAKTKFDDEEVLKHVKTMLEELGPELDVDNNEEDEMEDEDLESDTDEELKAEESMDH